MCAAASTFKIGRKMALVIGNDAYKGTRLNNCVNDATDLGRELENMEFNVTIKENLINNDMRECITNFVSSLKPADFVVFFFAGHGIQHNNENYLIPCDDDKIEDIADLKHRAISMQYTIDWISDKNPFAAVYFLDCCRTCSLPNMPKTKENETSKGMAPVAATAGVLITFASAPGTVAVDILPNGRNGIFTYHLLKHIDQPGKDINALLTDVKCGVIQDSNEKQIPHVSSGLTQHGVVLVPSPRENTESFIALQINIPPDACWSPNGVTIAGGNGKGSDTNQLNNSLGLLVDDDQTIVIADCQNHRIVQWKKGDTNGQIVAGGNGKGSRLDQLNEPTYVLIDKEIDSLIICDRQNRRVVRWSRRSGTTQGEVLIDSIDCYGVTMDGQRHCYVSDYKKHEIRRYQIGESNGTLVAGGNGEGADLNQLNSPRYIFVDRQQTVYVSDYRNNRVMKWNKGAKEGIVIAGGQGAGSALTQLNGPAGLFVDASNILYVADANNNRVLRYLPGDKRGTVIAGENGEGSAANQFTGLRGLSFDRQGNLYVVDFENNRVQRFSIA